MCFQCRQELSGVEYFKCAACDRYGTIDKYPPSGTEVCTECLGRAGVLLEKAISAGGAGGLGIESIPSKADLIAAAPELLRAAVMAMHLIRGSGFTETSAVLTALKAAIAKAGGSDL